MSLSSCSQYTYFYFNMRNSRSSVQFSDVFVLSVVGEVLRLGVLGLV